MIDSLKIPNKTCRDLKAIASIEFDESNLRIRSRPRMTFKVSFIGSLDS